MMRKMCIAGSCWLAFGLMLTVTASGQNLQIVADEFPPFNYTNEGTFTGIGTEVVQAILAELHLQAPIKVYPWKRAYKMALEQKNTLIFTIARTPEREDLFAWVGIVAPGESYMFALADRDDVQVAALADAQRYRIGAVREDARAQFLLAQGFVDAPTKLELVGSNQQNVLKLFAKRIDLWIENELTAYYLIKQHQHEPATIKKAYHVTELSSDSYIAFQKDSSPELIESFKTALAKIKENGTYDKILAKYR